MMRGRLGYTFTYKPQLFCTCGTHLRISKLNSKLWCDDCYEYKEENKLMEGFIKGIE